MKINAKNKILFFSLCFSIMYLFGETANKPIEADLIIFSHNSPYQLFDLLTSIPNKIKGIGTTEVIYRFDDPSFEKAYKLVEDNFKFASFSKVDTAVAQSFKSLLLKAMCKSTNAYVLFANDDLVIVNNIDLASDITKLENSEAYAFFYVLGKNSENLRKSTNGCPDFLRINKSVFAWSFMSAKYEWCLPNTLEMALYRKTDIAIFKDLNYLDWQTLEAYWARRTAKTKLMFGLCHENPCVVHRDINA